MIITTKYINMMEKNKRKELMFLNRQPVSVPYLRNKYMIELLGTKDKIEPISIDMIFGYETGFNCAEKLFNNSMDEFNFLLYFVKWLDENTDWKENNDTTNGQVVFEYLKLKYTQK